ncbi:MAG: hypothetical protein B5M52_04855 [Helicobacteraceae bacterium 4484_230]|nr:MAG: hypothetical protein B5M52_04855 [Helicobacteraceae bacterium 4484_230]
MKILMIEATKYTPMINLDPQKGVFEFKGKSYPENTFDFYSPVIDWIEKYFMSDRSAPTRVNMDIIYFNSSSSKLFFDFFDILDEARKNGYSVEVNWYYDKENESSLEAGEDFKEDFEELTFNLIEK